MERERTSERIVECVRAEVRCSLTVNAIDLVLARFLEALLATRNLEEAHTSTRRLNVEKFAEAYQLFHANTSTT